MPTFPSISHAGPARPANKIMPNRRRRLIEGARAGAQSPRQAPCTQAVFQKHGPLCAIGADPAQTFAALLKEGVIVRHVGIANHLRVSIGTEVENEKFLAALAKVLGLEAKA